MDPLNPLGTYSVCVPCYSVWHADGSVSDAAESLEIARRRAARYPGSKVWSSDPTAPASTPPTAFDPLNPDHVEQDAVDLGVGEITR